MRAEKTTRAAKSSFATVEKFIDDTAVETERTVLRYRFAAFYRFPLLFSLLALFGGILTVFGFERLLEEIGFFAMHPLVTLVFGLAILGFTGALYKHLS